MDCSQRCFLCKYVHGSVDLSCRTDNRFSFLQLYIGLFKEYQKSTVIASSSNEHVDNLKLLMGTDSTQTRLILGV